MPVEDEENEDETDGEGNPPPTKKSKKTKVQPMRVWKSEDIAHPHLPELQHPVPEFISKPHEFFSGWLRIWTAFHQISEFCPSLA